MNLNQFMAHLSCQQRKTPVDPLNEWVEDFGLWTITDGLESPTGIKEHAEAATAWLIVAGADIHTDPAWGRRDGNKRPGVPLRTGPLWTKRLADGDTQEMRWGFWKGRLHELANDETLDRTIRDSSRKAEQAMNEVELSA